MRPQEARVFIVEDTPLKQQALTKFVERNGGVVVGSVDNIEDALTTVQQPEFPNAVNGANVVLIDGNLRPGVDSRGADGAYVFNTGLERARLHRADTKDGLGAVAIGSSIDPGSEVAFYTGANLLYVSDISATTEQSDEQWAMLLDPQPVDPIYLPEGVMQRKLWENGWYFGDMAGAVLPVKADDPESTVTVHSLNVQSTKSEQENTDITHSHVVNEPTEMNIEELIKQSEYEDKDFREGKIDKHQVVTLVCVDEYLYVLHHTTEMRSNRFNTFIFTQGKTDRIEISGLSEIPDAYWQSIGLDRPDIQ